jgi:hypothetical protein
MTTQTDVSAPSEEGPATEAELWNEIEAEEADKSPTDEAEVEQDAPEEQEAEPEAPAGNAEDASDIWAKAPPEVRAEYEKLQTQFRRETQRTSALQRKINELTTAPAPQSAAPATQSGEGQEVSDADLAKLEEEYPEIAKPLLRKIAQLEGAAKSLTQAEYDRQQAYLAQQESALAAEVPDWQDLLARNGEAFLTWIEDQPKALRDAAQANATMIVDAQAAAQVMGRFRDFLAGGPQSRPDQGSTQPARPDRRQRQLAAAATPRSRPQTGLATGIPADGDPEALWEAFDRMERQAR